MSATPSVVKVSSTSVSPPRPPDQHRSIRLELDAVDPEPEFLRQFPSRRDPLIGIGRTELRLRGLEASHRAMNVFLFSELGRLAQRLERGLVAFNLGCGIAESSLHRLAERSGGKI